MAKLKNTHKIFDMVNSESLTIGHNRTLTRINKAQWQGSLHGNTIFYITCDMSGQGDCSIKLDTCGYMTPTTRQAMADFCAAFGVPVGVSFAKGVFTVRSDSRVNSHNGYGIVRFYAQRYKVEA